ncbi:MAG TPA: aldo/keto reductase [Firmicutes bacterium]|nr:aldo/keto reductase [Bacillota bacterium]
METRILGRTGLKVNCFAFGGILLRGMEQSAANRAVAQAIERHINYFDVAPSYGDAQNLLGPALAPYRADVVLACKTVERTKDGAAKELRDSLSILQAEYFDIYQLHALDKPEEIETVFGPGGAMEALLEARDAGLIRHIGFSAHSRQAALTLLDRFDFDTVMFPLNYAYWLKGQAGPEVVKRAEERNMGCIAIKALAHRPWLPGERQGYPNCWYKPINDHPELADLALRFILSQRVHVAISPGDLEMLWLGAEIASRFQPITDAETARLKAEADTHDHIFADRY